jgi:hypothetical protein
VGRVTWIESASCVTKSARARISCVFYASSLFGLDHSSLASSWRQSEIPGGNKIIAFRWGVGAISYRVACRTFRLMPDITGRARFWGILASHPRTKREADLREESGS